MARGFVAREYQKGAEERELVLAQAAAPVLIAQATLVGRAHQVGQDVVARLAPARLDLLFEERRHFAEATGSAGSLTVRAGPVPPQHHLVAPTPEVLEIVVGYADHFGDHAHRHRNRQGIDEVAASLRKHAVDLLDNAGLERVLTFLGFDLETAGTSLSFDFDEIPPSLQDELFDMVLTELIQLNEDFAHHTDDEGHRPEDVD